VHITDYFQFIFSMLPPDFSNQPTNFWVVVCKPILVFSFSFDQAEQFPGAGRFKMGHLENDPFPLGDKLTNILQNVPCIQKLLPH
jgi:hypothetical protein